MGSVWSVLGLAWQMVCGKPIFAGRANQGGGRWYSSLLPPTGTNSLQRKMWPHCPLSNAMSTFWDIWNGIRLCADLACIFFVLFCDTKSTLKEIPVFSIQCDLDVQGTYSGQCQYSETFEMGWIKGSIFTLDILHKIWLFCTFFEI